MQIKLKTTVNTQVEVDKELPFDVDDIISYEEGDCVRLAKVDIVKIVSVDELEIHDTAGYNFRVRFVYDPSSPTGHDARNGSFKLVNRTKNFPK